MSIEKKQVSRCMFCNSTSYGTGCPYSPHKKHIHVDDPRKCIYCGSVGIGTGCPYNPFSKLHVRGVEYNLMTRESAHKSFMAGLFLTRLLQPIYEMPAFKLGLIDEKGHKIKDPNSDIEKNALTPLDFHILKLRRLIGEDIIDLLKSNILLEMSSKSSEKFDSVKYEQEVKIVSELNQIVDRIDIIFKDAAEKGFSCSHIENLFIESIIRNCDHTDC